MMAIALVAWTAMKTEPAKQRAADRAAQVDMQAR
jgi:hypothetical protein